MKMPVRLRRLHPAQQEIFDSTARFRVISAGRRFGKTAQCFNRVLLEMVAGKRCMFLVPEYDYAKQLFRELSERIDKDLYNIEPNKSELFMELKTGGSCKFFSFEAVEKIRGREYDYAVLDEASLYDLDYAFFTIIRPLLARTRGCADIISTPRGHNGFYNLWTRATNGELGSDYAGFHFTIMDNPHIPVDEIESIKATETNETWQQEYMANATANVSNPFKYEYIQSGLITELSTGKTVAYGIDISGGRQDFEGDTKSDATVVIGLDRYGAMTYHDSWRIDSYAEQTNRILALPKSTLKVLDASGFSAGRVIAQDLMNKGHFVEAFNFTKQSKPPLMYSLIQAVERSQLRYTQPVVSEMNVFQMRYQDNGHVTFGNQSGKGNHDDNICALAMAWKGLTEFIGYGTGSYQGITTC